jgi:glycosyltransferase involved in cell wall biosynthesis
MISIIIGFYERLDHLKCCLDSLSLNTSAFDEVVVADDGSSLKTVEAFREHIKKYDFPITHAWQPNKGFRLAASRNNGIRQARGDYLIFLDCDFLVLPNTIAEHLQAARPGKAVAGGFKYLDEPSTTEILNTSITQGLLEKLDGEISNGEILKRHRRTIKRTILIRLRLKSPKSQSLGSHYSIHKKDLEKVNGYDENFVGWGGEDEDLGIRLVRAGIYCRSAIRSARVLHLWHPPAIKDRHWQEGPNNQYFNRKEIPVFCINGLQPQPGSVSTQS